MPRNMSFAKTTEQIRARTKTVTRRFGWANLKPGDIVNAVEQSQGLKKGERVVILGQLRIKDVRVEPLNRLLHESGYGRNEVNKEGFPELPVYMFVSLIVEMRKLKSSAVPIRRIEFEYV
jgi:hypothetical protein